MMPRGIWVFCLFFALVFSYASVSLASSAVAEKDILADTYTHYIMGILYDNDDRVKPAVEEYTRALKNDPSSVTMRMRLAVDYIKLNRYDDAVSQLKSVAQLSKDDTLPRVLLAFIYTALKKFDAAADEYKKILNVSPDDPDALSALADIYSSQNKPGEALLLYSKLAKQGADSGFTQFNMGIVYSQLNNFKAAADCFKKSITIFEKSADEVQAQEGLKEAYFYLGIAYDKLGGRKEAKAQLRKVLDLDPVNHEALNYLGFMYAEDNENLDEAILMIKKALEFEPDSGAYLDSLGWAYFKKGMFNEALTNLEKARGLDADPEIARHLKTIQEKARSPRGARLSAKPMEAAGLSAKPEGKK